MDSMVEEKVSNCLECQATTTEHNSSHPITMSPLPSDCWTELSLDLMGPLPSSEHILVLVDDYSRYPVVHVLKEANSSTIIDKLKEIFS